MTPSFSLNNFWISIPSTIADHLFHSRGGSADAFFPKRVDAEWFTCEFCWLRHVIPVGMLDVIIESERIGKQY